MNLDFLLAQDELGRLICDLSGVRADEPQICHSAIEFGDGVTFSSADAKVYLPDGRVLPNGVNRWKSYLDWGSNDPAQWVRVRLPVTPDQEAIARAACEETFAHGYGYDLKDLILGQTIGKWLKIKIQDDGKYVCSEFCTEKMQTIDWFTGWTPCWTAPIEDYRGSMAGGGVLIPC